MVGKTIRKLRLESGLTQSQLADITGYTQQCISKYEKTGNVDYRTFTHICDVLNVDIKLVPRKEVKEA